MTIQANFPAIKPSLLLDFANTKQLDSRITYTRASTASFYNGVTTAMAEQNVLTYSQDFTNAIWVNFDITVVSNATTAPDGTTTAELLYPATSGTFRRISQTNPILNLASVSKTISVYAKASGKSWLAFYDAQNGDEAVYFDVTNGVVGTTFAGHTASITSVGNGWYRCVTTTTNQYGNSGSSPLGFQVVDADGSFTTTVSGTNGIFLWGAQLEQRSAVTAYTATTTQAITNYIPALQTAASGVARFDNNPTTGESLGLLIEESRTNLVTYSSDLSNAAWTKTNATITSNTIVAPDGTLTGDKIVDDTTLGNHSASQGSITFANATSYTITFYAKAGEISYVKIGRVTGTAFPSLSTAYFNLTAATVLGSPNANWTNFSITDVGNGWRRCSATVLTTGSGTDGIVIFLTDSSGNTGFTGNNYNGAYIWGVQVELGAFATSYIPTVASQVTRAADAASMTGTNFSTWFNAGEGTIYSESAPTGQTSNGHVLFSMLGTADNAIASGQYISSSNVRLMVVTVNNSNQVLIAGTNGTNNKIAGAYKINDFASSINGAAVSTDTSGTLPVVDKAYIGSFGANGQPYTGTIKKVSYYPIRLSNTNLVALTS